MTTFVEKMAYTMTLASPAVSTFGKVIEVYMTPRNGSAVKVGEGLGDIIGNSLSLPIATNRVPGPGVYELEAYAAGTNPQALVPNSQTGHPFYVEVVGVPTIPPVATALTATAGAAQIVLAWTAPTTAPDGYRVYRGMNSGGPYAMVSGQSLLTGITYTDTDRGIGLMVGLTYYYIVVSVTDSIESCWSLEVSGVPT